MRGPSSFAIGGALVASLLPGGLACCAGFCCGVPLSPPLSPPLGFASCFCSLSLAMLCLDLLAVILEHTHLAAVFQRLHAGAVGLLRAGIEERDVRDVDRQVLFRDSALLALHPVRPPLLLHAGHTLPPHLLALDTDHHP